MKKFDLIIVDTTCPFPYEAQTLQTKAMGGTEASVIRVSEGLGAMGATVGVVQHNLNQLVAGPHAFYLPMSMLDEIDTYNYVMLRGTQYVDRFPRAKKYSWHEDVPTGRLAAMRETFIDHNVTVIAASKWHKYAIQALICDPNKLDNPRVTHIYNPVPDTIYVPKTLDIKYDKNKLVWIASPHKGLDKAVEMFHRLIDVSDNKDFRLHIFNPGYFADREYDNSHYIVNHGAVPAQELWQHVSESLCVFYPTNFEETFGCIAAEANALHTPVLTCEIAALSETVSSQKQFVKKNDPKDAIDRVIAWHAGDRPKVWGNDDFRMSKVVQDWYSLLANGRLA